MSYSKMVNGVGQMKVKVAGRIFDSANGPIMIIMDDNEKEEIQKLDGNIYTIVTPRMSEEEIEKFKCVN